MKRDFRWFRTALAVAATLRIVHAVPISSQTVPEGINNLGQIVGFSSDDAGIHGFLDVNGVFSYFDVPGARNTFAYDINDFGQIVLFDNDHARSYLAAGGRLVDINLPGSTFTAVQGINNTGQIVGVAGFGGPSFGFVNTGAVTTFLQVPGAVETDPFAINNLGQVVGVYFTSVQPGVNVQHGFLYAGGVFTTIDVPGGTSTMLQDINDSGEIVGFYNANVPFGSSIRAFRYSQGSFSDINVPGSSEAVANGTNNSGDVVGAVGNATGFLYRDGVFTTIEAPATVFSPEPGSLILITAGLIALGWKFRINHGPGEKHTRQPE